MWVCLMIGCVSATLSQVGVGAGTSVEYSPHRISELICALGHEEYPVRERATRELLEMGEPARGPLSVAQGDSDAEIRWRAAAAAAILHQRWALAQVAGKWKTNDKDWLHIDGVKWSSGTPRYGPYSGEIRIVKVDGNQLHVDLRVQHGPTAGQAVMTILQRDGEKLLYSGTYGPDRPRDFEPGKGNVIYRFVRE